MVNISLFAQLTQLLPKDSFKSLVYKHQSDKANKGINSWTHLLAMLFCHIGQACSVRDIANGLKSCTGNLQHLGISRAPSKSSLSYINAHRSWHLFRDYYFALLDHFLSQYSFSRPGLHQLKRKVLLLDASVIPLCLSLYDWASFRKRKGAVKLHLLLDYDGCLPVFADLTHGNIHEVQIAKSLDLPKGSVVVFDKGYIDYKWMHVLDSKGVFFVTRAKDNMAYLPVSAYDIPDKTKDKVLEDSQISLSNPKAYQDYKPSLRLVRFLDSKTAKEYTFITNNFHWSALTIAEVYRQRWLIEVFFKHLKQQFHVKSFVGTTENAVQIQVWTALIAMLLLRVLQLKARYKWHLSNLITFIRLNLFVKIDLFEWLHKPFWQPPPKQSLPGLFSSP